MIATDDSVRGFARLPWSGPVFYVDAYGSAGRVQVETSGGTASLAGPVPAELLLRSNEFGTALADRRDIVLIACEAGREFTAGFSATVSMWHSASVVHAVTGNFRFADVDGPMRSAIRDDR
ncbi:hypothetical protein [Kibdelosporangium philippinense]|uniref:hypothetical protein n=1 Tax=Kibdelosporangium philippinense TaxID=211113 RepID=UPI00360ECE6C